MKRERSSKFGTVSQTTIQRLTIAAMLHTSVLAPHFAPSMTSGDLYCLVWMSFVKWWLTQHAFPKSAIFTEMISAEISCLIFSAGVVDDSGEFLSRLMPDTCFSRISLCTSCQLAKSITKPQHQLHLRSLFSLLLSVICMILLLDRIGLDPEFFHHRKTGCGWAG
jgi:hypothetical protein